MGVEFETWSKSDGNVQDVQDVQNAPHGLAWFDDLDNISTSLKSIIQTLNERADGDDIYILKHILSDIDTMKRSCTILESGTVQEKKEHADSLRESISLLCRSMIIDDVLKSLRCQKEADEIEGMN